MLRAMGIAATTLVLTAACASSPAPIPRRHAATSTATTLADGAATQPTFAPRIDAIFSTYRAGDAPGCAVGIYRVAAYTTDEIPRDTEIVVRDGGLFTKAWARA